jgi:hypothetical protein
MKTVIEMAAEIKAQPRQEPVASEPVILRRGDILRCIETDELCTVWATSTTGKTLIKWSSNNFGSYTAEQIGELFWTEPPQPEREPVAWEQFHEHMAGSFYKPPPQRPWVGLTDKEIQAVAKQARSKDHAVTLTNKFLRDKNT